MLPQRNGCLEQGQADRGKAAATTQARLVDLEDAPDRSRACDLTMFNLAIDSKLRGSNLAHERPLCAKSGRSIIKRCDFRKRSLTRLHAQNPASTSLSPDRKAYLAGPATERPRTLWRSIRCATNPLALASSTKSRRKTVAASLDRMVPIAC